MLCSYQYGSIASKSRVSARVNKTQCLPSCHSLLLQVASSEPIIKGKGTAAGSCCNMALQFDTRDKKNTLKQPPVSPSEREGDACPLQPCFTLLKVQWAALSFQSGCMAHLAKFSCTLWWHFRKLLSPLLQTAQPFHPSKMKQEWNWFLQTR